MSQPVRWITIILTLITLSLIGWNLADFNNNTLAPPINNQEPVYQSQHTSTVVYTPEGKLSYKLTADEVQYYATKETSWFTDPVMTLFDKNAIPTWSIRADRAKLTKNNLLYLYGHVEVKNLTRESQLKKIATDNAQVNLMTQDVTSDDEVTLSGTNFTSNGMKMRGNLREKTAELINKVKTNYEIQNPQTTP